MPPFRTRTQADELARRRSPSLGRRELKAAVAEAIDDAGLGRRGLKTGWMVEFDADVHIALRPFHREGVVAGVMLIGKTHGLEHLLALAHANLEHRLCYFTGSTGPPELDARIRIPVDPFDREGLLLGLESLAQLLDELVDEDMSALVARIRGARTPQSGSDDGLRAALDELGLPGEERDDGEWQIETSRGPLGAILAGETWMFLLPLKAEFPSDDEPLLRWLLDASGARGARLGLSDDGRVVFATIVLPAGGLNASGLAYAVDQVLRLGAEADVSIERYRLQT